MTYLLKVICFPVLIFREIVTVDMPLYFTVFKIKPLL